MARSRAIKAALCLTNGEALVGDRTKEEVGSGTALRDRQLLVGAEHAQEAVRLA